MERGKVLNLIENEVPVTLQLANGTKHTGKIFYVSNANKEGDCLIKLKDDKENYITTSLKNISFFQANLAGF